MCFVRVKFDFQARDQVGCQHSLPRETALEADLSQPCNLPASKMRDDDLPFARILFVYHRMQAGILGG